MKKILINTLFTLAFICSNAAPDVVILGKPNIMNAENEGQSGIFWDFGCDGRDCDLYITTPFTYLISSVENDYDIWLTHYNYDLDKLILKRNVYDDDTIRMNTNLTDIDWRQPDIKLNGKPVEVVDVDEFLATKTKKEALEWAKSLKGKMIMIVHENKWYDTNRHDGYMFREAIFMTATKEPEREGGNVYIEDGVVEILREELKQFMDSIEMVKAKRLTDLNK